MISLIGKLRSAAAATITSPANAAPVKAQSVSTMAMQQAFELVFLTLTSEASESREPIPCIACATLSCDYDNPGRQTPYGHETDNWLLRVLQNRPRQTC